MAKATIFINGKIASETDLKQFTVTDRLTHTRVLLIDPGYGPGFPAYRFLFNFPVADGDVIEFIFENMAYEYKAAQCFKNGEKIAPAHIKQVKGLGI